MLRALVLMVETGSAVDIAQLQQEGVVRTEVLGHRLPRGRGQLLQVRVDFAPAAVSGLHMHPGEEIVHVLQGSLHYELQGRPPVRLHRGESLVIPAGIRHRARNVGEGPACQLATYLVPRGRPMMVLYPVGEAV
ncbi:MAG TPA: cupin domain-containing protein [Ramlibacter sp.]|jgi:quercetin dioxygenase-like cupin family protein|nr:cupin domain-containing protein [Ramlibacter sp.]